MGLLGSLRNLLGPIDENVAEYEVAACGHETLPEGKVSAFQESATMHMPRNEAGGFDFCLDCIAAMTVRCAWCGQPIFVGSPVTLYTPKPEYEVPDYAVVYADDPLQLVGCLGRGCTFRGADRAGFWVPDPESGKGHVRRVASPLELIVSGVAKGVIINDLYDPAEEPTIL